MTDMETIGLFNFMLFIVLLCIINIGTFLFIQWFLSRGKRK
jgi:energy-converting hydrogenase Eha subunit H